MGAEPLLARARGEGPGVGVACHGQPAAGGWSVLTVDGGAPANGRVRLRTAPPSGSDGMGGWQSQELADQLDPEGSVHAGRRPKFTQGVHRLVEVRL